jgi:hypothetical protein
MLGFPFKKSKKAGKKCCRTRRHKLQGKKPNFKCFIIYIHQQPKYTCGCCRSNKNYDSYNFSVFSLDHLFDGDLNQLDQQIEMLDTDDEDNMDL